MKPRQPLVRSPVGRTHNLPANSSRWAHKLHLLSPPGPIASRHDSSFASSSPQKAEEERKCDTYESEDPAKSSNGSRPYPSTDDWDSWTGCLEQSWNGEPSRTTDSLKITYFIGNEPARRAYEERGSRFHGDRRSAEFEAALGAPGLERSVHVL